MISQEFEFESKKDKLRIEAFEKETQRLRNVSRKQSAKITNLRKAVLFLTFFFISLLFVLFLKGMVNFSSETLAMSDIQTDSLRIEQKQLSEKNKSLSATLALYRDSLNKIVDKNIAQRGEAGYKYRIQIGAFKEINLNDYSINLATINQETYDSIFQYTLGIFDDYQKAVEFWDNIKKMGFTDSFIIATKDGRRINLNQIQDIKVENQEL